jgi:hypothetical protein
MNNAPRTLVMLAAGVVLLMAATLAADVVLSNSAISVVGPPTSWTGEVLRSEMTGAYPAGAAIRGYATVTGTAVHGSSVGGAGVYGASSSNTGVRGSSTSGDGGHFTSSGGYGVYAYTGGTNHWDHCVYASADGGFGVFASSRTNQGIRAVGGSESATGFPQPGGPWGVVGLGTSGGTWGSSVDNYGVYGTSTNYRGVYGNTNRSDRNYGLHTYDNIYSLNYHLTGASMQVAQNVGSEPLQPGDVVAFRGIRRLPPEDALTEEPEWAKVLQAPVVQIAKARQADGTGLAGVVYSRYVVTPDDLDGEYERIEGHRAQAEATDEAQQDEPREITPPGPAEPGDLVLIVVHGPAEVRVEPYQELIEPGDQLVAGGIEGHAAKALTRGDGSSPLSGTVFGTALERIDPERDTIYAYVAIQ